MKKLGEQPLIDPTAQVRDSSLGRYTEVGARTKLLESALGPGFSSLDDRGLS